MKIAFVHSGKKFTTGLFNGLKRRLNNHEVISWAENETAPAGDFNAVVVMGKFTRQQMAGQTKLQLIRKVSAAYETAWPITL